MNEPLDPFAELLTELKNQTHPGSPASANNETSMQDGEPVTSAPVSDQSKVIDLAARRCALLDRERHERDRTAKRGYDYDGRGDQSHQFEPGEIVQRVFDLTRLGLGTCEVCGESADIVLRRNTAGNGRKRFCAPCWRQQPRRAVSGKREKHHALSCPLCGGRWSMDEPPQDSAGRATACTTRHDRDLVHCLKYVSLLRELDADELARPYVTAGPFCPWPRGEGSGDPYAYPPDRGRHHQ